jgi:rSAM/selenodomain-associated transferase 2
MQSKNLSIILPVLNEAAGIRATLQALAPWRARGAEVIVVDGGSSDGTAALCEDLADQVLAGPCGRARQMNHGAAHARASALLFLHADTQLPPEADQHVARALQARHWGRFDVHIVGRSRWLPVVAACMNLRSRWTGIATGDQALFMRRSAFDTVGGFPDQPLMEDVEISRRLRALAAPACLRQRVRTSGRRWDERGAWRTIVLMWLLRWRYWRGTPAEDLARAYR